MNKETILAIITIVPALAWFVRAFVNMFQMYRENQEKIAKVAKEGKDQVVQTATQLKNKVENEAEKLKEKIETRNDEQPPNQES